MEQTKQIKHFRELQLYPQNTRVDILCKVTGLIDMSVFEPEPSFRTQVLISDQKSTFAFYIWKPVEDVATQLTENGVYKITGTITQWNGKPGLKYISASRMTDPGLLQIYDKAQFRKLLPDNQTYFIESTRKIRDFRFRRLVEVCYGLGSCPAHLQAASYAKRLEIQLKGFGSIRRHDSYAGGYINHVVGTLRMIDSLEIQYGNEQTPPIGRCEAGSEIKWDLVRTLAYLHDLGKQATYVRTASGSRVQFRNGTKLGHEAISVILVSKYSRDVEPECSLDWAEEQWLLNGIQDHGRQDYNKSPEEKLFSSLDLIDTVCVDNLDVAVI